MCMNDQFRESGGESGGECWPYRMFGMMLAFGICCGWDSGMRDNQVGH